MHARDILNLPDFIANAGGVICAAVEYAGGTEVAAFAAIEEKIARNTREVFERARQLRTSPRQAAVAIPQQRVRKMMTYRRWH
jgi:glutamate dehydrogenase (NAD(P)+)